MVYVYMHTVPNGKVYIGQSANLEERWSNGVGYNDNLEFYRDIKKYGWDNISHEILKECNSRSEALFYELAFTLIKQSENPDFGYNKTTYQKDCDLLLKKRKKYNPSPGKEYVWTRRNIFLGSGKTTSEVSKIIDEHVFSERDRIVLKRRLIDDIPYKELATEFGLSEQMIKKIVRDWQDYIKEQI